MTLDVLATFEQRAGGVAIVRSTQALGLYPHNITDCLTHWATVAPDRTFLAERDGAGNWRRISYAQTIMQVLCIAQSLLDRRLSSQNPVMILSGNSIEHALLALACLHVGILYVPLSPSTVGALHEAWHAIVPGLVFTDDGAAFEASVATLLKSSEAELITLAPSVTVTATSFAELLSASATPIVDAAHLQVAADAPAKLLFTSGSTSKPKGIITTQRMLCSNQEMLRNVITGLQDTPPVLCDWLPWNHIYGGSHNFGLVLYNGGTFYIDAGKPTRDGFAQTMRNLQEVAPTIYLNVPGGYAWLLPALRNDSALRKNFFSQLQVLFSAGAQLSENVAREMKNLANEASGYDIPFINAMGATETGPLALYSRIGNAPDERVGLLPVPGVELKLTPMDDRLEARVRGPNVTPGFWNAPAQSVEAFDDEGFFKMSDALAFLDVHEPALGLRFDGRFQEDFKLSTGTWVHVHVVRKKFLEYLNGIAQHVVLAAPDRDYLTALIFAFPEVGDEQVRGCMMRFADENPASSRHVKRAILLHEHPSTQAGEITGKGTINQDSVWKRRTDLITELYTGSTRVIDIQGPLRECQ